MLLACWWRRHVHDYCTLTRSTQCRKGASGAFFGGEDLYHKLVEFLTRQLRSIYEVRSSLCACAPGRRSRCVVWSSLSLCRLFPVAGHRPLLLLFDRHAASYVRPRVRAAVLIRGFCSAPAECATPENRQPDGHLAAAILPHRVATIHAGHGPRQPHVSVSGTVSRLTAAVLPAQWPPSDARSAGWLAGWSNVCLQNRHWIKREAEDGAKEVFEIYPVRRCECSRKCMIDREY